MTYALIENGEIVKTGRRPNWLDDSGQQLGDDDFAEYGWHPVDEADPVPEGKIVTGREIQIVDDLPKWVNALEDAPPPSTHDIDHERDRRIEAGFTFNGTRFQSRVPDRENIAGASVAALAAITAGVPSGNLRWHGGGEDFVWIAEDNSLVPMDAQTMFAFGQAAMAHKQAMIFAARAIKDAETFPADYADDSYWP